MTLASYPESDPKACARLWLSVNHQHRIQVFDLSMHEPKCILVGSADNVDVRIDAVAPVAFYLEREGAGVRLTAAFPDPTLRIDARRAERTNLIYEQAVLEFSGQRIDLRLSAVRPEPTASGSAGAVSTPAELDSLRAATVIEATSSTTAYTPVVQPFPSGQNPTVAVLDARRAMPVSPPARTVAIDASRFEELRAVRLAPRCEATQLIELGRNTPLPPPHEPARFSPVPHAVGPVEHAVAPLPYRVGQSQHPAGQAVYGSGPAAPEVAPRMYESSCPALGAYDPGRSQYEPGRGPQPVEQAPYESGRGSYDTGRKSQPVGQVPYDPRQAPHAFAPVPLEAQHIAPVAASAPHRAPPRNPQVSASTPNSMGQPRLVPSPASVAAGVEHPGYDRSSGHGALAAEEVAPTGLEPAPIVVLSPSGEREIPRPPMGFAPVAQPAGLAVVVRDRDKGATTAVELPTTKPESLDCAPPTVLQSPALPVQRGPDRYPSGDVSEPKNLAQSIPAGGLMDLVRKHPVGVAGGVVALGFVLVVFGLGLAQILGISPRAQASGERARGTVQPIPLDSAPVPTLSSSLAPSAERRAAVVSNVQDPAPPTSSSAPQPGRETLVVALAATDENTTLAVGHLFAGRLPEAEQVYRTLATRHPDDPTYATAARILARRNSLDCRSTKPKLRACPTVKQ